MPQAWTHYENYNTKNNNFNPEPQIKMVSRKLWRDWGQRNHSHHIHSTLRETSKWGGFWGRESKLGGSCSISHSLPSPPSFPWMSPHWGSCCVAGQEGTSPKVFCCRTVKGWLAVKPSVYLHAKVSLAIRFWESAKDEFSVGDHKGTNMMEETDPRALLGWRPTWTSLSRLSTLLKKKT